MTLTSEEMPALEATSRWWKLSLVMMKTMDDELKVTFFLGLLLALHDLVMTMGLMGRSTLLSGRSLMLRCSQVIREQSSCSKQRRNWRRRNKQRERNESWDNNIIYCPRGYFIPPVCLAPTITTYNTRPIIIVQSESKIYVKLSTSFCTHSSLSSYQCTTV